MNQFTLKFNISVQQKVAIKKKHTMGKEYVFAYIQLSRIGSQKKQNCQELISKEGRLIENEQGM